jgi:hypothetical protein
MPLTLERLRSARSAHLRRLAAWLGVDASGPRNRLVALIFSALQRGDR